MTPAVGAGLLSLNMAVMLGGIINLIGVFFLGESVSKTVGNNFATETLTLPMVFIILTSMGIWLFIVSLKGIPISTTQSVVGSVLGIVLIEWGPSVVNYETLIVVVLSWIISPLLGLLGGYLFYIGILKIQQSSYLEGPVIPIMKSRKNGLRIY